MSDPVNRIRTFDRLLQLGLLAPVLAVGALAYACVFAPIHSRARDAEARLSRVERMLRSAPATRREHAELERKLADLEARAEGVRLRIPDGPEEAEFLQQIHQAAEASQVAIDDYRRGEVISGPRHSQLEVRLVGSGEYAGLCRFFHAVSQFRRQTQVRNLLIRAAPDEPAYRMELSLLLFYRSPGAVDSEGGTPQ